jgi:hypothetical protein
MSPDPSGDRWLDSLEAREQGEDLSDADRASLVEIDGCRQRCGVD